MIVSRFKCTLAHSRQQRDGEGRTRVRTGACSEPAIHKPYPQVPQGTLRFSPLLTNEPIDTLLMSRRECGALSCSNTVTLTSVWFQVPLSQLGKGN